MTTRPPCSEITNNTTIDRFAKARTRRVHWFPPTDRHERNAL